jgi:hypothetical protein
MTHPLETVTSTYVLLDISKESRPKVVGMEDLVSCPSICKVPPARFIVACFEDVEHLIFSHTSMNNHVRTNVKEIPFNPGVWRTHFNNPSLFLG